MKQITRISPCVFTEYDDYNNPQYGYKEEIIVAADALRFRNGEGENAVCVGKNTTATGECSFAAGENSNATAECSFALGKNTVATNECSFALGKNTTATAECSFAAGENSNALGYCSFALGYNVETHNNYSLVCGHYNDPLSCALFAVGCGTPDKRNNAITVYDKCTINDISYSTGDTVINGVTAYASGKVKMPGITANADGTVDIPKLSQLSNYATKSEVNTIAETCNNLSKQYTNYVSSNNQVTTTIRKTGNENNIVIRDYVERTFNVNDDYMKNIIYSIGDLFQIIGDGINRGHGSASWAKSLKNILNNGSQNLKTEFNNYLRSIGDVKTSLVRDLKDF